MEKDKKTTEKTVEEIKELLKLPEYEADFSVFDIIDVNDYRASKTLVYKYFDEESKAVMTADKMEVSEANMALFGLKIGLKSLGGDKVEDNLEELIIKHLKILPNDIIRLYNDMASNVLKKKSEQS